MPFACAAALLAACGREGRTRSEAVAEVAEGVDAGRVSPDELRAAVSGEPARRFYQAREWQPAWTQDAAAELAEAMARSARHGLDPDTFLAPVSRARGPVALEVALTDAALGFADALGAGLVDPGEVFSIYTLPRPKLDAAAALAAALAEDHLGEWLDSLAPDSAEYRALSSAYLRYAREAAEGGTDSIGGGEAIREGNSDPRVPRIAEALRSHGYLAADAQPQDGVESRYTATMAAAVERLQEDFGIAADGVVGPDTLEVINTGPLERARTLAVNLERLRWLERRPPETRIDVNIAAATLAYYRDGELRDRRRVVVGQADWETPQLGSPIFRLVANPTWTVPKSIEEDEIAGRGPGYLRRNNMVRRDGWIVQLPGPDNALGQVKFDMRNDHAIYLHDTPSKSLFARSQRHYSHGCVRVDDAVGFARLLARDAGVLAEYERARASGEETFVTLPQGIPVRLIYRTAFADGAGKVLFRTDPYGWDDRVAAALGYEARQAREFRTHIRDIGP